MAKGKKTGGRNKGTPNLKKTVAEICAEEGCCPISVMVKICKRDGDPYQFQAAKELAGYLHQKQSAIQISGPDNGPIKTEVESSNDDRLLDDFEKLIETKLNETKRT